MFKGKSTIELFDGITGKKKSEYTDQNLVTNALQNMFDFGSEMVMSGVAAQDILSKITPLYPNYLRGILLWDSSLPETPDVVIAPPGVKCVGHAGQAYSGAKATRGTYNDNESSVTENSIKMVWDFGTDKANSTIKSVSLTSIHGGDAGWLTPWEAGIFPAMRPNGDALSAGSIIQLGTVSIKTGTNLNFYFYCGELRRGIHTFVSNMNDGNLTILEQSAVNHSEIRMFDRVGLLNKDVLNERIFTVASDANFINIDRSFTVEPNGNFVHVSLLSTTSARVRTINLISKAIVSDITITLAEAINNNLPVAFFKNHLYVYSTTRGGLCKFNTSGQFIERVSSVSAQSNNPFSCIGDYLISPSASASVHVITDGTNHFDMTANNTISSNFYYRMSASFKPPFYIWTNGAIISTNTFQSDRNLHYLTPYLATINNLNQDVVKTSQNTMKITYELSHI